MLAPASWPKDEPGALYGLGGEVVRALAPYTEADPMAMLAGYLAEFGAFVGPEPAQISPRPHIPT